MALATPTISYTDGAGASTNLASGAVAFVTPGNALTITLQSSTGVVEADFVISAPGTSLDGYRARAVASPWGFTVQLPSAPFQFTLTTEVTDGNNASYCTNVFYNYQKTAGVVHRARGVSAANNESLTAFVSVTGGSIRDGVTYAQGDYVLLAGQTSKLQNGLYVVGVVASGTAPLTRAPDFATGTVFAAGQPQTCEVAEGTLFANTAWKITTTGAITVDTTNHDWYPRQVTQAVTLVTGFTTATNVPILSTTKTAAIFMPQNFSGASTTVSYRNGVFASGGAATVAGVAGTGSVSVTALVAAGTFNTNDISTGSLTIVNF